MKTLRRYNTPGDAHFLTFSCFERQQFLRSERPLSWLSDSLSKACEVHCCFLWAYVFMPEHVHLLIKPEHAEYRISDFLVSLKKSVSNKALNYLKSAGKPAPAWEPFWDLQKDGRKVFRFWQRGGGYDRNLHSIDEIREKVIYMHNNPVIRGLCETPELWRWSSAEFYATGKAGPIPVTRPDI